MNYYVITTNLDHVGAVPQIKNGMLAGVNPEDARSIRKMSYSNKVDPLLGEQELDWKGKFTDYLWLPGSKNYMSACVSNRMMQSIKEEITFEDYSIYQIIIRKRNRIENYNLIKFEKASSDIVSFKESRFSIYNRNDKKGFLVNKSEKEWKKLFSADHINTDLKLPYSYVINNLIIREDNILDFFSLSTFEPHLYCSQNFVDMVSRHGFTGMKFESIETYRYLNYPIAE